VALETLKDVKEIDGFEVTRGVSNFSDSRPVFIHDETNQLAFQIQNGPIKEKGVNGCQVDTIIEAARLMILGLNKNFPCRENSIALTKLEEALMWMKKRKENREKQGVEGLNQAHK
jgi:hypothetical protein